MNDLFECKKIAKSRNGKCLSKVYSSLGDKLVWECEKNHKWKASLKRIKYNHTWCPECTNDRKRFSLVIVQKMARQFKGKCLSKKYINSKEMLVWECGSGHRWKASLWEIRQGRWCKKCKQSLNSAN